MTSRSGPAGGVFVGSIVLLFVVSLSQDVFAYVDLGSGSYMLQFLTASLFGMLFAARSLWARVRARYSARRAR